MRSTNTFFTIEQICIEGLCEQGMFIKTSISRKKNTALNIDALTT